MGEGRQRKIGKEQRCRIAIRFVIVVEALTLVDVGIPGEKKDKKVKAKKATKER